MSHVAEEKNTIIKGAESFGLESKAISVMQIADSKAGQSSSSYRQAESNRYPPDIMSSGDEREGDGAKEDVSVDSHSQSELRFRCRRLETSIEQQTKEGDRLQSLVADLERKLSREKMVNLVSFFFISLSISFQFLLVECFCYRGVRTN